LILRSWQISCHGNASVNDFRSTTDGLDSVTAAAQFTGRKVLCVAVGGVSGWMGEGKPLRDFDYVTWQDRDTVIMFDSDAKDKIGVRAARRKLAVMLADRGAVVKMADLSKTGGNGPDDVVALDDAAVVRCYLCCEAVAQCGRGRCTGTTQGVEGQKGRR
jgi:hypothetical protein